MKYVKELFSGTNVGNICFEKPYAISFGGVLLQSIQYDGAFCNFEWKIGAEYIKELLSNNSLLNHFSIRFSSYSK